MLSSNYSEDRACVYLGGDLVFSDHGKFREILTHTAGSGLPHLKLDFSGLTFIDSAGLGMLLLLRDEAAKRGQTVTLANAGKQVKRMFEISRFNSIFKVE